MSKANMIRLHANPNAATELATLLESGADLVAETEPETCRWYALTREDKADELAVFDVFPDQAGRQAHFDGEVAAALSAQAPRLVEGGWNGVLANVTNYAVLAAHVGDRGAPVGKATYISVTAAPGKAAALAAFLTSGRDAVASTERETLYWVALQSEDCIGQFAIFDLFADEDGRAAHFGGVVAKALAANADELVAGGWEDGVLANVVNFDVRAVVTRDA